MSDAATTQAGGATPKPAAARPGPSPWLIGCIAGPLVLVVILSALVMLGFRAFVSYGIVDDLTKYQAAIRNSDLGPEAKKPLIERLERLRDRARDHPIGFWRWLGYNSSVQTILADGQITPEELEALDHELDRMEKEFR